MKSIFNLDSPFFRLMGRVADLLLLNLAFLVCSLPVITIGPALTALFYVALKIAAGDEPDVLPAFWRSFRQNFRQGVLLWLILLAVGGLLAFDLYAIWGAESSLDKLMRTAAVVLSVLYLLSLLYVFPLLARFENSVAATLRFSVLAAILYLPRSALMLLLPAAAVGTTLLNDTTLRYGIFLWLALGFSGIAVVNSMSLNRIFATLKPAKAEPEESEESLPAVTPPDTDEAGPENAP